MKKEFKEALEDSPIIAAIKDDAGLTRCLDCDSQIIFILYGDIITIPSIVEKVKGSGKLAFVHMDLIQGLSSKEAAVDYISKFTKADGIISTKAPLISRAKDLGLCTIMRFFFIDSMAYDSIEKQLKNTKPDVIEVLPGPMPSVVRRIRKMNHQPLISSGLISEKEDVYALIDAGATAISTTVLKKSLWLRLLRKPGSTALPFISTSAINTRSLSVCRPSTWMNLSLWHSLSAPWIIRISMIMLSHCRPIFKKTAPF